MAFPHGRHAGIELALPELPGKPSQLTPAQVAEQRYFAERLFSVRR
jgi:hypothetical protein